jgi:hypothetical protein
VLATRLFSSLALTLLTGVTVSAGKADVITATAQCDAHSVCRFTVTVEHADGGWQHYADRWDVMSPEGNLLGSRVLLHPHVAEQPFTRTLSDVKVPRGLSAVRLRARDSVHGYGGYEVSVPLPR